MKQIVTALIITLIGLSTFAQDKVAVNDANAQQRTVIAGFTAITVSDGINLYLTQGNEESVAVSASEEKYMERFKTVVENGTLKIYFDKSGLSWLYSEKRKLNAYVSFKALEKISASSGADVILKSTVSVNKLQCTFTSGAHFSGHVNVGEMAISQNSGSEIDLSGKTEKLQVDVSSGAIFKGYDLAVDFCEAKATSGGGVRITVNKELNAKANSGGGIRYKGNAVMKDLSVSSGGMVKKESI
jgi:hypothetical protein